MFGPLSPLSRFGRKASPTPAQPELRPSSHWPRRLQQQDQAAQPRALQLIAPQGQSRFGACTRKSPTLTASLSPVARALLLALLQHERRTEHCLAFAPLSQSRQYQRGLDRLPQPGPLAGFSVAGVRIDLTNSAKKQRRAETAEYSYRRDC